MTERRRVKLWHFMYDVSMGGMIVVAVLVLVGVLALLAWGLLAGPPLLAWPLRGVAALLSLRALGRWFGRECW